jgi:vitamin B12 transporter
MPFIRYTTARAVAALVLAYPFAATAASAKADSTAPTGARPRPGIESIVVTAQRVPTDAPVLPVLVRDPATAPMVGVDILRDLPSLAISQSGSFGSLTQVRARGAEANHLLVLVDGVDVMDPTTDSGFNFANLNLSGISSVEYLPGAQSAIWGNQALAGVMQLTTEPAGRVRRIALESGSFDSRASGVQLSDRTDDWYYNVSGADFTSDGTNTARQGSERDGFDSSVWSAAGGLIRDRWTLRTLARRVWTTSEYDPTPFPAFLPVDGDQVNTHDELLGLIGFDVRGEERAWEHRLALSLFDADNTTESDGVRTATTDGRRWKVASVTDIPLNSRHNVIVLLETQEETFEQRGEASFFGDPNQHQELDRSSAGLEYVVRPGERWRLSASARHDVNSDFADSDTLRLAGRFQWRDDTSFWMALGNGITLPSFVERFGYTPDTFIGNPDLEAEENQHVSIGTEFHRGRWSHALTLYRDQLEDEINGFVFDPAAGGFTAANEDGTSDRLGAEWNSTTTWLTGSLHVGASWLDSEDPDGTREIRRPRRQGFATVTQQWRRYVFDAGVFRIDEQTDLDFATFPANTVVLDAYTLANAGVRAHLREGMEVGLRWDNLLDETYEDILGYRAPGRSVHLTFGVEFQ